MSYGIYIGKNLTRDGVAYLGGYGDEPSSHWLEVVSRQQHSSDATITVGVNPDADMPGIQTQIPQVRETSRHIRVSYSYYKGVPPPITNGGLNEHGVAVRDIWSTSRTELIEMTPPDQCGPNYSDLARIVMERARSARGAVELIGELILEHGYTTYGGNSHFIADQEEAWIVIECAGGRGLWAAQRVGDNDIRASRPGYIEEIPVHESSSRDYLYSPNLVAFALEQGWFHEQGDCFDFNRIYGDGKGRWAGVRWIEEEMARRARRDEKIGIEDVMWAVRTDRLTGDTAGYGQVVPLHHPRHDTLRYMWHTQIGALAAPFVPVFMGVQDVPEEFRQHRYLSVDESSRFLDMRHALHDGRPESVSRIAQGIESTRSATRVFKRLLYLINQHGERFLPEVTEIWEAIERRLIEELPSVVRTAEILIDSGESGLASSYLTYYVNTELTKALTLAGTLADGLEARTRALHGISTELTPRSREQIW